MEFDELASERQPEPGTFDLLVCCPDLAELLEDRLLVLWRDAHAGIHDRDLGHAFVHRGADIDPTTLGRELEGIGQQVQEHLFDLALVGADRAEKLVDSIGRFKGPHAPSHRSSGTMPRCCSASSPTPQDWYNAWLKTDEPNRSTC